MSMISGSNELEIDLRGPVGQGNDINGVDDWKPYLNEVTESDLDSAWEVYFPESEGVGEGSGTANSYNDFLADIQDAASTANDAFEAVLGSGGEDSFNQSSVEINAGGGEDVIALNSNDASTDTVVFEGNFGENTIYNFGLEAEGGNDVLDFTSYLDEAAAVRAESGQGDDFRNEETVEFSFNNGSFDGDHNEISLLDFSTLWDELEDDDQVSFADFGTSELELALNEAFNSFAEGGADSAVGNQFLILVSKDGDALVDEDGDFDSVDTDDYATNEFKVFQGVVAEDDDEDYVYEIINEAGLVNLANSDLGDLQAEDFGF